MQEHAEPMQTPRGVLDYGACMDVQASSDNTGAAAIALSDHLGESVATPINDLSTSVMRTVVSNGNDALNLLFEAASQQHAEETTNHPTEHVDLGQRNNPRSVGGVSSNTPSNRRSVAISRESDAYRLWKNSRFVRSSMLSVEDIIVLLDL